MRQPKPITLSEHMRNAVKARWAKTTPEQRSDHARKLVAAREAKRKAAAAFDGLHGDIVLICTTCRNRHYPRCKSSTQRGNSHRNKPSTGA